jgi:hypothetical protein
MSVVPKNRDAKNHPKRVTRRGLARFEVLGLDKDRELIRSIALRLADNGPDAALLRATICRAVSSDQSKKGGILAALRRSPLVGADLDLRRPKVPGR